MWRQVKPLGATLSHLAQSGDFMTNGVFPQYLKDLRSYTQINSYRFAIDEAMLPYMW